VISSNIKIHIVKSQFFALSRVRTRACAFSFAHTLALSIYRSVAFWLSRALSHTHANAEYSLFYRALLHKRPIILRSLLIAHTQMHAVALSHTHANTHTQTHTCEHSLTQAHIHTHTHTFTHTSTHSHTHTHIHSHKHTVTHTSTHSLTPARTFTHTHITLPVALAKYTSIAHLIPLPAASAQEVRASVFVCVCVCQVYLCVCV